MSLQIFSTSFKTDLNCSVSGSFVFRFFHFFHFLKKMFLVWKVCRIHLRILDFLFVIIALPLTFPWHDVNDFLFYATSKFGLEKHWTLAWRANKRQTIGHWCVRPSDFGVTRLSETGRRTSVTIGHWSQYPQYAIGVFRRPSDFGVLHNILMDPFF